MARKKITPAPQTDVVPQAGSVQQTAADIPVQDLKDRFQARSIPLETDFWNLIDVADCGRKAAGLSPDVIPVTDTGLVLDDITGQLKVIPETDKGISVSDNGVGVVANPDGGIIVGGSGVGVLANAAKGIIVDSEGVGINTTTSNGLTVSSELLKVAISGGISGLYLSGSGLSFSGNSHVKIMSLLYGCEFYSDNYYCTIFATNSAGNSCVLYFFPKQHHALSKTGIESINGVKPYEYLSRTYENGRQTIDVLYFNTLISNGSVINDVGVSENPGSGVMFHNFTLSLI